MPAREKRTSFTKRYFFRPVTLDARRILLYLENNGQRDTACVWVEIRGAGRLGEQRCGGRCKGSSAFPV